MPAPESVQAAIDDARKGLKRDRLWLKETISALAAADRDLQAGVAAITG